MGNETCEKKSARVVVRLTHSDSQKVDAAVAAGGYESTAHFLRALVTAHVTDPPRDKGA